MRFTNSAGESFVLRDVGPTRSWVEDGNLMIQLTGRVSSPTGVHIGTLIVNAATNEVVFSAGQDLPAPRTQACEALS